MNAPVNSVPFQDNLIGDGTGATFFALSFATPPDTYTRVVLDSVGNRVSIGSGQYGDSSHPRVLPQAQGFLFLEGLPAAPVVLHQFSSAGTDLGSVRVFGLNHTSVATALDRAGGALIVTNDVILGSQPAFTEPWQIFAQRFNADLSAKTERVLVAQDMAGATAVQFIAGAVAVKGSSFVVWTTFGPSDVNVTNMHGAWVPPAGRTVVGPIELGTMVSGDVLDVQPVASGGVAVAGVPAAQPLAATYTWTAQVGVGSSIPDPAGVLSGFPFTRLGIVRGGRANALLRGVPFWPDPPPGNPCEPAMAIPLVSAQGTSCGTLSLPIQFPAAVTCNSASNDATLGRDGTVIVQTIASVTDEQGTRDVVITTAWPQILK